MLLTTVGGASNNDALVIRVATDMVKHLPSTDGHKQIWREILGVVEQRGASSRNGFA